MRLPPATAVRPEAVPAQPGKVLQERSKDHSGSREPREPGIRPQGCCGANVCLPFVGCHCVGIEAPFC
jgi:hypothetical protein